MNYFSPWWITLSQRKILESITPGNLSICLLKLSSSRKEAMKGMEMKIQFSNVCCPKTETKQFFSPESQMSNSSTDLGDFLVRSYAKQIRERNATTGNVFKTINSKIIQHHIYFLIKPSLYICCSCNSE